MFTPKLIIPFYLPAAIPDPAPFQTIFENIVANGDFESHVHVNDRDPNYKEYRVNVKIEDWVGGRIRILADH